MRRENSSLYETEKTKQVISISHTEPIIEPEGKLEIENSKSLVGKINAQSAHLKSR